MEPLPDTISDVFAFLRAHEDGDARLDARLAAHGADPLHIPPASGMLTAHRLIARLTSRIVAQDAMLQDLQAFKAQMITAMMLVQADVIRLQQDRTGSSK